MLIYFISYLCICGHIASKLGNGHLLCGDTVIVSLVKSLIFK